MAVELPEAAGDYIGAAGQFVSGVLQTAGIYAQGRVLENFADALESVGSLLFAVAIIGGLMSVTLFGDYKRALYLLFGPAVFFWMLHDTVPAKPTMLRFGDRWTSESKTEEFAFLGKMNYPEVPQGMDQLKVSRFFVIFDNLVSSIVQGTVGVLIDQTNRKELVTIANEHAFSQVLHSRSLDPLYIAFVSKGMIGHCADVSNLSAQLSDVNAEKTRLDEAEKARQAQNPPPQRDPELEARLSQVNSKKVELEGQINKLSPKKNEIDSDMAEFYRTSDYYNDNKPSNDLGYGPLLVTCDDIWAVIKEHSIRLGDAIIKDAAEQVSDDTDSKFAAPQANDVEQKLRDTLSQKGAQEATHVAAAYMLRNALGYTSHGALNQNLVGRARFNSYMQNVILNKISNADSKGGFLKLSHLGAIIPYLQGLLLYILSMAFPFFCLFLLMPSRASAFFIWMSLWIWVKTWDVGFAATFAVREILWNFVTKGVNKMNTAIDWDSPGSVLQFIHHNDPLATLNTYFTIVAVLTFAIPAVTAHLCIGAGELFDALKSYFKHTDQLAKMYEGAWRRREVDTPVEKKLIQNQERAGLEAAQRFLKGEGLTEAEQSRRQADWESGSGAFQRMMEEQYRLGKWNWQVSDQNRMLRNALAATTGRTMSYTGKQAHLLIGNDVNKFNERFNVRPFATGMNVNWFEQRYMEMCTDIDGEFQPEPMPITGWE